ncbi:MAG: 5,10-methylenetetrahydromethanopterin reductase [Candidatus Bathyarchaeota archaeon]|nr:MAG: 5,10-methylenetetrahydromethanopterin reductase [Candidatus Bathyarchaeota archaeon]
MVEFGIEFVPRDLYWKTTFYAIQAEKNGFNTLWITDHFNNRNVYVSLAIVSAYTEKIKFGPGVTNPYMAHPIVTAQAVSTLNEIAPGRVVCGLGVGDRTTLEMVNLKPSKPLATIRESVRIIRAITSGENLKMEGKIFSISGAKLNFKTTSGIPIFVGAQGPKMLALAAEVGDGILINASHPNDIEKAIEFINIGVDKASKRLTDVEIAAYTSFCVAKDQKKAEKAVVPVVAYIVAGCPESILQKHNISMDTATKIRQAIIQSKWKEAFSQITDEMIEAFSICGSPEIVTEKISKLIRVGTTQLVAGSPIGPNIRKSINMIAAEVFPHFREKEDKQYA